MARPFFLFQGIRRDNDHQTAIRSIFSIPDLSQVILSVAYVRETGVLQLEELLKKYASSSVLTLDRSDTVDELYISDLLSGFSTLRDDFPEHVIEINAKREIAHLLEEGRIEDERIVRRPPSNRIKKNLERDKLKRIKLNIKSPDFARKIKVKKKAIQKDIVEGVLPGELELVWISKGLTERDLNIPTGRNTNATGSMLFKKGQFDAIDQRTYFRQIVFSSLSWSNDRRSSLSHLERAQANFEIMVKGINYGVHRLKLTHNSRTDTEAYRQLNAMTQIHWGEVKNIVAQRDLLERELRLYRRVDDPQSFAIEID